MLTQDEARLIVQREESVGLRRLGDIIDKLFQLDPIHIALARTLIKDGRCQKEAIEWLVQTGEMNTLQAFKALQIAKQTAPA